MSELLNLNNKIIVDDALHALQCIQDNIIDLTITSPPYNKRQKAMGGMVKKVEYDSHDDNTPEHLYQENQINVLNQIYRITKEGCSMFYNHKCRWFDGNMIHPISWLSKTKWIIKQEITWDRIMATNIRGWRYWQIDEKIYWLYKPTQTNNVGEELLSMYGKLSSVWREPPERNSQHPAPFPLWMPVRIIKSIFHNQTNKLILDPYMGSGTTAVASSLLHHNYIGIDISENYKNMAEERIKNKYSEAYNLNKELSKYNIQYSFTL